MEYKISQELANAVFGYLVKRPYDEVFQLVDALRQLKPVEEKQPELKSVSEVGAE